MKLDKEFESKLRVAPLSHIKKHCPSWPLSDFVPHGYKTEESSEIIPDQDDFEYNRQAVKNMSEERDYFLKARDSLLQINAELVNAGEALMKIDFHDEICVMNGDPYGVSTMELVKAKAKMDGALRKQKSNLTTVSNGQQGGT